MAAGFALKGRSGGTVVSSAPVVTAPTTAPAVASYGPAGAQVVQTSPGLLNSNPGSLAVYAGIGALVLLVLMRQSLPK